MELSTRLAAAASFTVPQTFLSGVEAILGIDTQKHISTETAWMRGWVNGCIIGKSGVPACMD